jgi:hypothetical protein
MIRLLFLLVGAALGAAYFGHLWLDVARRMKADPHNDEAGRHSGRPLQLLAWQRTRGRSLSGGFALRFASLAVAFVLLSRAGGTAVVMAGAGLILARTILVWRLGRWGYAD